jgi:hypothetical protein
MGINIFDPDDNNLPDFGHEVLGLPKGIVGQRRDTEAVSSGIKAFWSFVLGAFLGLAFGFALGAFGTPGLVMEAMK